MRRIEFALVGNLSYGDWVKTKRTPSEWGILSYLRLRQIEGGGPATREEILSESGLSEKTVDGMLRKLQKQGEILRQETYVATPWRGQKAD